MDSTRKPVIERFLATCQETERIRASGDPHRPSLFRFSLMTWLLATLAAGALVSMDCWAYEMFRNSGYLARYLVVITIVQTIMLVPFALICEILVRNRDEGLR